MSRRRRRGSIQDALVRVAIGLVVFVAFPPLGRTLGVSGDLAPVFGGLAALFVVAGVVVIVNAWQDRKERISSIRRGSLPPN